MTDLAVTISMVFDFLTVSVTLSIGNIHLNKNCLLCTKDKYSKLHHLSSVCTRARAHTHTHTRIFCIFLTHFIIIVQFMPVSWVLASCVLL